MNKNAKKPEKRVSKLNPNSFKEFNVKESCLLLDFLIAKHPQLSRNNVKNILSNHQVSVNGAPVSQYNLQLVKEDVVIVSKMRISKKERHDLPIIFEDKDIVVINKPAGLLSVASDTEKGRTAYRMVNDFMQQKDRHNRIFVVHRLDEDTSGVLIFAKNHEIQKALQKDWSSIVSSRGYFAVVEGQMEKAEDKFVDYLAENSLNLMYVTNDRKKGKLCTTAYKVISDNKQYSLLDVHIFSGRKNQIRVQMGKRGHYVVGDDKYGEPSNPLKRLGLHAYELALKNPITGKEYKFNSPMPKEFLSLFKK